MINIRKSLAFATVCSLPLASAATPAAWSQIDQVYDVNPPIYEERELESVEIEANESIWPYRGFVYEQPLDFDSEVALPLESVTMLYEGQPIPLVYRLELGEFDDIEFDNSEFDDIELPN